MDCDSPVTLDMAQNELFGAQPFATEACPDADLHCIAVRCEQAFDSSNLGATGTMSQAIGPDRKMERRDYLLVSAAMLLTVLGLV